MKKILNTNTVFSAFLAYLINFSTSLAIFGVDPSIAPAGASQSGFKDAVQTLVSYLLGFLGVIAVVVIVYSGVRMVLSDGEEEAFTKAKTQIIYAIIGLVIIILSYSIVTIVSGFGAAA